MASQIKCAQCGAPLSADAPAGQCPICLLGLAMASGELQKAGVEHAPHALPFGGLPFRFFGDYELLEEIARGGMGVVYRARQLSLNRPVALKMILDGPLASRGFIQRFQIEAEAAAKLNHPNIVPIYEIGQHEGRHFFSMRFLEGGNLGERLADFALPFRAPSNGSSVPGEQRAGARQRHGEIVHLMINVARAVQHAHERGILHRDLKPANILLDAGHQPHLTDFGLAKLVEDDSLLTQTGSLLGTPAYMAPEQASGKTDQVTTSADIYSLGAVLYHLLAGRPPFQAATVVETMRRVVEEEAAAPDTVNALVERDLSVICLKCLHKTPSQRYTSARSFAEDLERWTKGETILARPATRAEHLSRWCRRKPAQAALAGAVLLLLVAVAVVSTTAAIRINKARDAAVAAQLTGTEKLWDSYLAQARAQRFSGRPGRRFDSLQAIANAAAIRPSLELRNEAIACLALVDIRPLPGPTNGATKYEKLQIDWVNDRYARANSDCSITFRRLDNDAALFTLPTQSNERVEAIRLSANGLWLAVGYGKRGTTIWNLASRAASIITTNEVAVDEFRPDNCQYTYVLQDGSIIFVELPSLKASAPVATPLIYPALSWSPDGKYIATLGTNEIFLMEPQSMRVTRHFPLPAEAWNVAWSPDGTRLAAGGRNSEVYLVDTRTDSPPAILRGHQGSVTSVRFSPDGSLLASGGWDGKARLWDTRTFKEVFSFTAGPEDINFSRDGRRLAIYSHSQSRVTLSELAANDASRNFPSLTVEPRNGIGGGDALLFGEKGDWLATAMDNALTIWNPDTGEAKARFEHSVIGGLIRSPGNAGILSWSMGANLSLLNLDWSRDRLNGHFERFSPTIPTSLAQQVPRRLFEPFTVDSSPERACGTPNGHWVALSFGQRAYVFDLASKALHAVTGTQPFMKFTALSPDGRWVATGGWHVPNVKVWDASTGELTRELPSEYSPNVAFSPDGRWLAVEHAPECQIYASGSWELRRRIVRDVQDDFPGPITFSNDGSIIAVCYKRSSIRLISVATGESLAQIEPIPEREIVNLAFSPDDSQLAVTRGGAWPEVWKLKEIRRRLAEMKLDW